MMRPSEIFVVVPTYNEGEILFRTVKELNVIGYTVVVVDDGSATPASSVLGGCKCLYLRHSTNLGQGAALQTGMDFALGKGAQIIVTFDADGQHSSALIGRLVDPIVSGECDVALGSRFIATDDRMQVPKSKRVALKVGVVVTWIFTRIWLSDTHNGFRALSRSAAQHIRLTEDGFAHATEIIALIRGSGLRYKEIATTVRYTEYSRTKGQRTLNGVNIVVDLVLWSLLK